MKFSADYLTRWHDTDASRRVKPSRLLEYMQETSNAHMASCGLTLDELRDKKQLAFILSKIRLRLYAPLYAYEPIKVETWTCPSRGFSCNRFYRVTRAGELIADVDSTWALVDLKDGKLAKIDVCGYTFEDEPAPELDIPLRCRMPSNLTAEESAKRTIVYSDLDYNMHMNNTKYPDMLCDLLPISSIENIKGFVLSYLHEAAYGDELSILSAQSAEDNSRFFKTVSRDGTVCLEAQVLFS